MSNLVFVSGDFCSGSTLLFTLFRKTGLYYCLYEPLHETLRESLVAPPRPAEHDHHFFVEDYHSEFRGFDKVGSLFDPRWGSSGLYLPPDAEADALYRYLAYIIGAAFGRSPRVMLKENRFTFRLGWLRARFPHAKVIHIYRRKEDQWKSVVRRGQSHVGREDIGQEDVNFNGFNIATWCEDLKSTYPELDARNFKTGYERFCKLWELSYAENRKYADLSVDYGALTHDFEATSEQIWQCLGVTGVDTHALKQFVVPAERQTELIPASSGLARKVHSLLDRVRHRYARFRVRVQQARPQKP